MGVHAAALPVLRRTARANAYHIAIKKLRRPPLCVLFPTVPLRCYIYK